GRPARSLTPAQALDLPPPTPAPVLKTPPPLLVTPLATDSASGAATHVAGARAVSGRQLERADALRGPVRAPRDAAARARAGWRLGRDHRGGDDDRRVGAGRDAAASRPRGETALRAAARET